MNWNSVRRWPVAALVFAASLTSAAQQPAPQPSPAVQPPVAKPSPQPSSVTISGRERVTVTGMVPIPDVGPGAPRYTSADIAQIKEEALNIEFRAASDRRRCGGGSCDHDSLGGLLGCEKEYSMKSANLAGKAAAATLTAEAVRREAAAGRATSAAVEAAELDRQDAVNKMQAMRVKLADARADIGVWQEAAISEVAKAGAGAISMEVFVAGARRHQAQDKAGAPRGLRIEGVRAVPQNDKKKSVLVQGTVRNSSGEAVDVPGLVGMLIDERNWIVARKSVTPDKHFVVKANSSQPFGFLMEMAPQAAKRAVVAFSHETESPARLVGVNLACNILPSLNRPLQ